MRISLDIERAFIRTITVTSTARVAVHKAMQNNMKRIWNAKIKPRNTKTNTEKAKVSDIKCQITILARIFKVRFLWQKREQTRFSSITSCIRKRYHEKTLAETCVSLRKHTEKWSGSGVSAATET